MVSSGARGSLRGARMREEGWHVDLAGLTLTLGLLLQAGFALVVVHGLLTGHIRTRGLLSDEQGRFSPARLQALLVTLAAAASYVASVAADPSPETLPEVPDAVLWLLAGSGGLYLSSKSLGGLGRILGRLRWPG
jgi:hypothetical protein